jgi:N-methylhydantoinase A
MTGFHRRRLAVDIGGTFTDVVLDDGDRLAATKVLTTPRAPEEGMIAGIDRLLAEAGLGLADIDLLVHGTTLATNAILERKGAVTALIATEGFRDVVEIAYESRYDQYDLEIEKPAPLVTRHLRFTVPERRDSAGAVRIALDTAAVERLAPVLAAHKVQAVAIAFLHAYIDGTHERAAADVLRRLLPEVAISTSHEVCPEIREYERTSTTIANAYVQPLMARYLARLATLLKEGGFRGPTYLMTSGGGWTTLDLAARLPIRLVESGPAGGAVLAADLANRIGADKVVAYDMGGTTAKISLIEDGRPRTARSFEVDRAARFLKGSGLPLRIPVIEMVEIGAGGGSIARVDALGSIAVGPESAASEPGPACYGRGGERPTVTDADLLLGRIDAASFAGGRMPLDTGLAASAMATWVALPSGFDTATAALGVSEMIDETMANAARVHAVEQGRAIQDFTMVAFGGAAPLHAGRLAEKLRLDTVIVPANAGVGSAIGFLRAPIAFDVVRSRLMRVDRMVDAEVVALLSAMEAEARAVVTPGAGGRALSVRRSVFMRYIGQGHEVEVAIPPGDRDFAQALQGGFDHDYAAQFARTIPNAAVECLTWSLTVSTIEPAPPLVEPVAERPPPIPLGLRELIDPATGAPVAAPVYARADLRPGDRLSGPAVIVEDATTTILPAAFDLAVDGIGNLVMRRRERER